MVIDKIIVCCELFAVDGTDETTFCCLDDVKNEDSNDLIILIDELSDYIKPTIIEHVQMLNLHVAPGYNLRLATVITTTNYSNCNLK